MTKNNSQDLDRLLRLAESEDLEKIKSLIDQGWNLREIDEENQILCSAIRKNRKNVVEFLLAGQIDINKPNKYGQTPLMFACWIYGNKEIIKMLLEKNSDVNKSDENGWTPLLIAAKKSNTADVAELLIANKADVNHAKNDGVTALMLAAKNYNLKLIDCLIKNGADTAKVNKYGYNALMIARSCFKYLARLYRDGYPKINNEKVIKLLRRNSPPTLGFHANNITLFCGVSRTIVMSNLIISLIVFIISGDFSSLSLTFCSLHIISYIIFTKKRQELMKIMNDSL